MEVAADSDGTVEAAPVVGADVRLGRHRIQAEQEECGGIDPRGRANTAMVVEAYVQVVLAAPPTSTPTTTRTTATTTDRSSVTPTTEPTTSAATDVLPTSKVVTTTSLPSGYGGIPVGYVWLAIAAGLLAFAGWWLYRRIVNTDPGVASGDIDVVSHSDPSRASRSARLASNRRASPYGSTHTPENRSRL